MSADAPDPAAPQRPTLERPRLPRLIATDLDGTLLRDDGTVSARTAVALRAAHEAGVEVVFVTARPPRWLDDIAHAVAGHGVVLCLNGAYVYEPATRSVLSRHAIPDDVVRTLTTALRRALPSATFAAERESGFAAEHRFPHLHPVPPDARHAHRIEDLLDGDTGKLLARCDLPDEELVARVAQVLDGRAVVADSGAPGLAEITGAGVTKGAALARWTAERGIDAADVWAFGDMPNDLPMLAWAGQSFAVATAHPAVLAAADRICPSNQEDGVASVIEALTGTGASGVDRLGDDEHPTRAGRHATR